MRRSSIPRGIAALLITVASAGLASSPAVAASQQVLVQDNAFVPAGVAVTPGDTVTWNYPAGSDHHNVHFEDEQYTYPLEPEFAPWMGIPRAFPAEGVYRYYCDEHGGPGGQGMAGVVYVNAGGTVPGLPPSASFTVSSGLVTTGQPVAFDAAASTEPDVGDSIARYEWDFDGDGVFEFDGGGQPATTSMYPSPGTRTVGLRVTDRQGHSAVTTRTVRVTNAPVASFTVSPDAAQTGQAVSFDASASSDPDGSIASFEWDLDGDGTFETDTGTTATTSRSYASPTTLTIRLRVTDNLGVTAVTTRPLQVSAPTPPPPPPPAARPPAPPPPPPAPPPGTAAADTNAPGLSGLLLSPRTFKAKASGASIATAGGTLVKYRLSEDATTTFTVQRIEKGRRKGKTCRRPSASNKSRASCTRYVTLSGSFKHTGLATKLNSLRFSGRVAGRKLGPARYRLTAIAKDAAGNAATAKTVNFRIVR